MFAFRLPCRDLIRLIAVTAALAMTGKPVQAQNRFAAIEIANTTKDITITYQIRWGMGEWGKEVKLEPGMKWNHWYEFEVLNQNRSPVPQISFASGINRRRTVVTYDLQAYATIKNTVGGKKYVFEKRTDADGEDYVDLFHLTEETNNPVTAGNLRYQEGLNSLEAKQYNDAIAAFTDVIAKTPGFIDAYLGRARAYRANKEFSKSIDDCNAALTVNEKSALAYNLRGVVFEDAKEFEKAFEDYSKAISLQNDFVMAYLNRANIHIQMGRYEQASADLNKSLNLKPNSLTLAKIYNLIGLSHAYRGQYDAAIAAYEKAIVADGKLAIVFSNCAAAHFWKGDFYAAIKDANEAIRLQPNLGNAYRWRSQAQGRLSQIEAARRDYAKAISLDPAQKDRFDYIGFLGDRRDALESLASFKLGSTVSQATLQKLNELAGVEPTEDTKSDMNINAKELISSETKRHDALQFEMVAAANLLLKAATLSPREREKLGWNLYWKFGPVTAPNNRAISKDGLAGLRILARLDLPGGQQIHAIFALKYFPPANPDSDDEGRVGLLSEADCFRVEVRLFEGGTPLTDYAHQSFTIAGKDSRMTVRPGFYLDKRSGKPSNRDSVVQSLGTSCITCHSNGPRLMTEDLSQLERQPQNLKEIGDFVDQLKHWGASKKLRQNMEGVMKEKGPAGLLPLEDMLRASQEEWIAIYPYYREQLKASSLLTRKEIANVFQ